MGWMEDSLREVNEPVKAAQKPQWMIDSELSDVPAQEASVVSELSNTVSDIAQAVKNPALTFGTMRAGLEQSIGGFQQMRGEQQIKDLTQAWKPLRTFAGIQEEDPLEKAENVKQALAAMQATVKQGKDLYNEGKALEAGLAEAFPQKSYLGTVARGVTTSVGLQLPVMAAAFILPELAVPLTSSMYVTTAGQKYGERRNEQGIDVETAQRDAAFHGTVEVATELGGAYFMGQFWKAAKAGQGVLKPFVQNLISEVVGESSATALQGANDFSGAPLDYIFSKQHLSDQIDTAVATLMQSSLMGIPGKVVQFDSKRRATNYVNQLQDFITEAEAAGETQIEMPGGAVVQLAEIKQEKADLEKAFELTIPAQEDEAARAIEEGAPEAPSQTEVQPTEGEVIASTKEALQSVKDLAEVTPEELANDTELMQEDSLESTTQVVQEQQPDPLFAEMIVQHLGSPLKDDELLVSSPALQSFSNYAEDLLISTDTKAKVAVLTVEDLRSNPEIGTALGDSVTKLVDYMSQVDAPRAAILKAGGRYVVAVGSGNTDAQTLELVTHEAVGHVIAYEHFDKATTEQKTAIEADYQAYVAKVNGGVSNEQLAKDMYPFNLASPNLPVDIGYISVLQDGTNVGKEWLANQITKWATTDKAPLTLADKWFKALANQFRKALTKMKRKGDTTALAVDSVADWLNSIFDPSRLDSIQNSNSNLIEVPAQDGRKVLSRKRQVAKLRKAVDPKVLERYTIGKAVMSPEDEKIASKLRSDIKAITKTGMSSVEVENKKRQLKQIEGKYSNAVTVFAKGNLNSLVPLKTITASSRSTAQREAEFYKLIIAAAGKDFINTSSTTSKRIEYYRGLITNFKQEIQQYADDHGLSFEQTWLNFIGDPANFLGKLGPKPMFVNMRLFNKLAAAVEHNPNAVKRAILYEKRVISEEVQEVVKETEAVNAELAATEKKVIVRKKVSVSDIPKVGKEEAIEAKQEVVKRLSKAPSNSDIAMQLEVLLNQYNDIIAGNADYSDFQPEPVSIQNSNLNSWDRISVPDEVSDEEAKMFMDMLDSFAAAWHGTPHRFEKFSTKHIGSGEGAQVYGWGLYFASNEKVARWYKDKLSKEKDGPVTVKLNGVVQNFYRLDESPQAILTKIIARVALPKDRSAFIWEKVIYDVDKKLENSIKHLNVLKQSGAKENTLGGAIDGVQYWRDVLRLAKEWEVSKYVEVSKPKRGALYKVELAPQEDEYLLWDEPLEEQSKKVRTAVLPTLKEWARIDDPDHINYMFGTSGKGFYSELVSRLGSQSEASAYLYSLGIRGNKYLDGNSRSKGEGHYNYVIFNEDDVEISEISDFAGKSKEEKKAQRIKDTLYKVRPQKRNLKPLTPDELEKREAAKLERRSKAERQRRELLKNVIKLAETAKEKGLALTEYLQQSGFSDEENVKMVRLYLQNRGVFNQREHIMRLATALGLSDSVSGDEGLQEFILTVFPKSYGTLDTIGIRGKDIILHRLQELYFNQNQDFMDFTKEKTLRDFKAEKAEEFKGLATWDRLLAFKLRIIDQVEENLSVTPAGSKIVYHLKQVLGAQYALYSRDYMRQIDNMLQEIPDKAAREELLERYLEGVPGQAGRNETETRYFNMMDQIFQAYGKEMEILGFKTFYNSGRRELFKHDPTVRYFPRMWPKGAFEKPSEIMIQSLIRSGEAFNEEHARKLINKMRRRQALLHVPRYANMEMARETNMDGWIKDPVEVLRSYVANGSRRLAVVRMLGPTAEAKLVSLAAEHLRQSAIPEAMEDAINAVNAIIGGRSAVEKDTAVGWGVGEGQAMAVATMLQHSQLLQPGVASNVSAISGYKHLIKGFSQILFRDRATREQAKARAFAMGVAERFVSREIIDNLDIDSPARERTDKLLRAWKMVGIDQWMRAGSALAFHSYLMEETAKAVSGSAKARANLKEAYVDADAIIAAYNANEEKEVEDWIQLGAFSLTQKTNFATDALTTPKILEKANPWMQMLTLFSRYSYHQHKYLKDMLLNHPERLFRQGMSTTIIGAPIYMLRLLAKGVDPFKQFEEDGVFATLYKMFMSGSGLGLFVDSLGSALMGYQGSSGGGPLIEKGKDVGSLALGAAKNAVQGKPITEYTYVMAVRTFVDAGIYVSARVLPAKIGIPIAAGLGFVAPAIEKNVMPTKKEAVVNFVDGKRR